MAETPKEVKDLERAREQASGVTPSLQGPAQGATATAEAHGKAVADAVAAQVGPEAPKPVTLEVMPDKLQILQRGPLMAIIIPLDKLGGRHTARGFLLEADEAICIEWARMQAAKRPQIVKPASTIQGKLAKIFRH